MLSTHVYQQKGSGSGDSWVSRFRFEISMDSLTPASSNTESIVIKNGHVSSVHEFDHGKMLVATESDLIYLDNWEVVRVYTDKTQNFTRTVNMATLPDFDLAIFPFIFVSGSKSINLINL